MELTMHLTVPKKNHKTFKKNYINITHNTGKLFLFAGDQKVEHLNQDFYGDDIAEDDASPRHLFEIASKARIGAFATQLGLIAQYGMEYPDINYIIKLNSKTNLVPASQADPKSSYLYSPEKAIEFAKNSNLKIAGFGYTVYLGSEHEADMLKEASEVIYHAHENGLVAILWMYPRGKAVKNEKDADIIAGAAGVGASLGADFVKINPPINEAGKIDASLLKQAILAAGKTKILCSGGKRIEEPEFLKQLSDQLEVGTYGTATGRNIHQKGLEEALSFCEKIASIIIDGKNIS